SYESSVSQKDLDARTTASQSTPYRHDSNEITHGRPIVDVKTSTGHQDPPVFSTRLRDVDTTRLRGRPDLLESGAQLVVEEEARVGPVRAPPACTRLGFAHRARRQLNPHG